jgi:signal transduction histidine kinase
MNSALSEKINLLIVDDVADNIMALEASLEQEHLNIFTTTCPKQALQICIDNDISIALIDVNMPEMGGFELLDIIKGDPLTEHILVLLMTGISMDPDHAVKGLEKGAVDYLFKPMDLYILLAKVNSLMTLVNHEKEIQRKNIELQIYQEELFKAIEQTERNRICKENFLANMSHEIRTPLNAIIGLTHLLKDSPINEDQKEMIKLMGFSSSALLGIVNDILESAKIDAGKIEIVRTETNVINLVETICDLTRPMANDKGLELICEIDKDVPAMILADSLRLNQIMMNLVNNAIKFTNEGQIRIQLKFVDKGEETVQLEFIVKDSGIGIPRSSIERIFTRFEQIEDKTWQKFGGTGLGLSIVKRLIKLKGGILNVESNVGVGTTFSFRNWYQLANFVEKTDIKEEKQISELPKFEDVSILLVEDNQVNQFIITEMLKEWNVKVDVANNGLEAFEKLQNNNYKLILMDTHMPVMNGYEATKKIRKEMVDTDKRDIPIISFSASVIQRERNEAVKAGVDDFIAKPFEPKILNNKIRKLIDKKNNKESQADY